MFVAQWHRMHLLLDESFDSVIADLECTYEIELLPAVCFISKCPECTAAALFGLKNSKEFSWLPQ